jgi:hypothetical protein
MTTVVFDQTPDFLGKILFRQYVSPLLAPQAFAGETFWFQIRTQASPAGTSSFLTWGLRAFNEAGGLLATLVPVNATGPKLQTVLTNEGTFAPVTITLSAPAYLVLELGVDSTAVMGSTHAEQRIGDAATSDLPFTMQVTTDLNPWFEFVNPSTLLFVYDVSAALDGDGSLVASAEVIHYVDAAAALTGAGQVSAKAGKVKRYKPSMRYNWNLKTCWGLNDPWPDDEYLYLP